jgi:hypothetical protein
VVGPGAYGDLLDYGGDHGYAPFSSTAVGLCTLHSFGPTHSLKSAWFHQVISYQVISWWFQSLPFKCNVHRYTAERQLGGAGPTASNYTPGPGSYRQKKTDWDVAGARREVSSGAFVSGVARLSKDTSTALNAPGPGSYSSGNNWIKNTHRYKMEPQARRVTFQRMPTAPSVPVRGQSYGYEESELGELILQKAPTQGHTGMGGDTVGPCVYEPKLTAVKSTKTTDFQSSRTKRGIFAVNANPGPGQYKPKPAGQDIILEVNERVAAELAAREAVRKAGAVRADPPCPTAERAPGTQVVSNLAPLSSEQPVSKMCLSKMQLAPLRRGRGGTPG